MHEYKVGDVFTPNDQPTITYVIRAGRSLEQGLRDHFETKNVVVSISGPSKTGKTVLIRNVLDMDYVIPLSGSSTKSIEDFFNQIFNWIEVPVERSTSTNRSVGASASASGGGELGLPLFAKGKADLSGSAQGEVAKGTTEVSAENPFQKIVREIGNSDFTVFVDDFHYIPDDTQVELAKVIKSLSENGVRICTASVPHRAEDVVRANPELRGRLAGVDITEWHEEDLIKIAEQGFEALNIELDNTTVSRLAEFAHGSPQLMQVLCLNLCRSLGVRKTQEEKQRIEVGDAAFDEALEVTATFANSAKLTQTLHSGPKVKGQPRMQYDFKDGTRGDVYRAILLGITADPVRKEFSYDEIYNRVKEVCVSEYPTGQSMSQSLTYMNNLVEKMFQSNIYFEWDEENLYIVDPYLAFYLRCSGKLRELGSVKPS